MHKQVLMSRGNYRLQTNGHDANAVTFPVVVRVHSQRQSVPRVTSVASVG